MHTTVLFFLNVMPVPAVNVPLFGSAPYCRELRSEQQRQLCRFAEVTVVPADHGNAVLIDVIRQRRVNDLNPRLAFVQRPEQRPQPDGRRRVVVAFSHQYHHLAVPGQR
jgi:hypothetical protein